MLIPIQHENMSARRWPIITLSLIVINVLCFLVTFSTINKQSGQVGMTRMHILMLAAQHPELTVTPETQALIDNVKEKKPGVWQELSSQYRPVEDEWDAQMRMTVESHQWQAEMDRLEQEYVELRAGSVLDNYGFVPADRKPISFLTANFLHLGWMHLIGNMWFLWLAGFVLEDAWGRPLYLIFYVLAGLGALQFYSLSAPGSFTATAGASGAVAGLMGAFLVRFPKIKIEMAWIWIFFLRVRMYRFKVPAYALLPLWLGTEVLSGWLFGSATGVAHWAHVGGFLFGAAFALVVRASGVEKTLTAKVREQMELEHDPEIERGSELLHTGKIEEAMLILKAYVAKKPDSIDGWTLLRQVQWRRNDLGSSAEASHRLIGLYSKAGEVQLAEQEFGEFLKAGGRQLSPNLWLEFANAYAGKREFTRAVLEYEKLARACPNTHEAILALVSAAKLSLGELHRAHDALRLFRMAEASSLVADSVIKSKIQQGIRAALATSPNLDVPQVAPKMRVAAAGFGAMTSPNHSGIEIGELAREIVPLLASTSSTAPSFEHAEQFGIRESVAPAAPATANQLKKPASWGKFDAPPVWGHGAKGDTVEKPDFTTKADS